jgi:hypothetical protein
MTIPTQPEPSDATRFATRPKQRKAELVNATDNEMCKLRKETVGKALAALAGEGWRSIAGSRAKALAELEEGVWRQWVADDRTLDPETVAEQFTRSEREHSAAVHNRAVLAQHGIRPI